MRLPLQRVFVLVLLGIAALLAFAFRVGPPPPQVLDGSIDLRGIDFNRVDTVKLRGNWHFYWQRFLSPEDLADKASPPPETIPLPGGWHQAGHPAQGYATLRLDLRLSAERPPLALQLKGFFPANRVWIDGREVATSGVLGRNLAEEAMAHGYQLILLPRDGEQHELVIHVSNFHLAEESGVGATIGRADALAVGHSTRIALSMFSAGTLLLMGFYHIALFLHRRKYKAPLYLGVYCLLWTGYVLSIGSSDEAIRLFWPNASGEMLDRIWQFCLFAVTPVSYLFYRALYPGEFPRWIGRALFIVALVYVLLALGAPLDLLSRALPFFFLVTLARMSYILWALFRAVRRRREGAQIILNGFALMLILAVNDMLNGLGLIDTVLTLHLGMIVYMFAQALALRGCSRSIVCRRLGA